MFNFNPETRLPYGCVQANKLDPEVQIAIHDLAYAQIFNELVEAERVRLAELGDSETEREEALEKYFESLEIDEPSALVNFAGFDVVYTFLGGSAILLSTNGPTVKVAAMCSPCVPGAADLDSGEGDIECHGIPESWYDDITDFL